MKFNIKKRWLIVSLAMFGLIGGSAMAATHNANADSNNDIPYSAENSSTFENMGDWNNNEDANDTASNNFNNYYNDIQHFTNSSNQNTDPNVINPGNLPYDALDNGQANWEQRAAQNNSYDPSALTDAGTALYNQMVDNQALMNNNTPLNVSDILVDNGEQNDQFSANYAGNNAINNYGSNVYNKVNSNLLNGNGTDHSFDNFINGSYTE